MGSSEAKSKTQESWLQLALRHQSDVRSGQVKMVPADQAPELFLRSMNVSAIY